ncbi:acetylglutamate kinase [Fictibacillus phosphorivorans]|uniref:acetylglutamate kinase n=1 Tax=Fictibacillus phosphorivorans TaxID=1221500 RepID=UPI001293CBE4|nr:acetylglutamate kinase [Fictibacillus phosphorivorans]MQR95096.1 acetylglutamate kinase [Fictibacillus phosphorivorans]
MYHVVKIGGSTLANLQPAFFDVLKNRIQQGEKIVIVHGGGPEINKRLRESGLPLEMKNGVRVTSQESLSCVKTALMDITNTTLVEKLDGEGIVAKGLSGAEDFMLFCDFLDKEIYGWVGNVQKVNTKVIHNVLEDGKIPVIASLGVTKNGEMVNINADTAAGETAAALSAESICFVTDTPGVSVNGEWMKHLTISEILKSIVEGHISGGMVPKVEAAIKCLDLNIKQVRITDQTLSGTALQKEVLVP